MSWRDTLERTVFFDGRRLIGASFRGVPFFVESSDRVGGRRTVTHEFPMRDAPYIEDLGRKARVFSIQGYVIGADYIVHRNALLEALEDVSGPGELVHPYHGRRRAICSGLTARESIAEGGMSVLQIEFTEAPAQAVAPVESLALEETVSASADAAGAASVGELLDGYDVDGLPAFAIESAEGALVSFSGALGAALAPAVRDTQELALLDARTRLLAAQAASLVRDPAGIPAAFLSALSGLAATVANSPGVVLAGLVDAYRTLTAPLPLPTTATRIRERANHDVLVATLRRILALEAARLAPLVPFESHEEAVEVRDEIADLLEEQAATAGDDAYPALVQLRADLVRAVPGDATLARLLTVHRRTATPSLLLAYQLYGSVEEEADIIARNQARHPGFLSGDLKVLSHV